ncbi:MAG: aldolase/citrate lyase family protein, partial [Pseudomonadota bacterium]
MELPVNKFKHALRAGKPQIGIWSSLSSHIVAEILSNSGFDWVLLDTEHSPNELPMVQSQLHAMQGGTATPIVRVAWNDMVMIKRTLDIGAQTLLVPYVQSVEEAKNAV